MTAPTITGKYAIAAGPPSVNHAYTTAFAVSFAQGSRVLAAWTARRSGHTNGLGSLQTIADDSGLGLTWGVLYRTAINTGAGASSGMQTTLWQSSPLPAAATFNVTINPDPTPANASDNYGLSLVLFELVGGGRLVQGAENLQGAGGPVGGTVTSTVTLPHTPASADTLQVLLGQAYADLWFWSAPPANFAVDGGSGGGPTNQQACLAEKSTTNVATAITWGYVLTATTGTDHASNFVVVELAASRPRGRRRRPWGLQ